MTETAAAGWYPDPHDERRMRYFDGTQWTDHYHDPSAAPAEATAAGDGACGPGTSGPDSSSPGPSAPALPYKVGDDARPDRADQGFSGIGTLLSSTLAIVGRRFGSLLGVIIGMVVVVGAVFAVGVAVLVALGSNGNPTGGLLVGLTMMTAIGLAVCAYQLIISRIFLGEHQGQTISVSQAWADTKGRTLPLLGIFVAVGIMVWIGLFLISGVLLAAGAFGLLILLPVLVFIWVKWAFLAIAGAASGSAPILETSARVSKGRFFPVLIRLLALSVPSIVWAITTQVASAQVADQAGVQSLIGIVNLIGAVLLGLFVTAGAARVFIESGARTDVRIVSRR